MDEKKEEFPLLNAGDFIREIERCGHMLEVAQETIAVAAVYFHRFYENERCENVDKVWLTICAALLLACKATENVRRPRDVINVCYYQRYNQTMSINQVFLKTFIFLFCFLKKKINLL